MRPKVWKYRLTTTLHQMIPVPKGSCICTVALQRGQVQMWLLVDEDEAERKDLEVYMIKTGHPFPPECLHPFIATVQLYDGGMSLHIFAGPAPADRMVQP